MPEPACKPRGHAAGVAFCGVNSVAAFGCDRFGSQPPAHRGFEYSFAGGRVNETGSRAAEQYVGVAEAGRGMPP